MALPDGARLRSDVSCTLFLADPDEYGGELIFDDTYSEREVTLSAGDITVYPSSSLHRAASVTRSVRLASLLKAQRLARDDQRRRCAGLAATQRRPP